MVNNKKLEGLSYEKDFFGDSSKIYGEKYLKNNYGENEIDPLTNTPISDSFEETHGDRIFGALIEASKEKADDQNEISREYDEMMKQECEYREKIKNIVDDSQIVGLKQESLDSDSQKHASIVFNEQENELQKTIRREEEEYKHNFEKLCEKIKNQEGLLNELTDKFNNHDPNDKVGKIELYHKVHEAMNELVRISYNFGSSIQNNNSDEVIGSLSAYDSNYNEDCVKKYIKEL